MALAAVQLGWASSRSDLATEFQKCSLEIGQNINLEFQAAIGRIVLCFSVLSFLNVTVQCSLTQVNPCDLFSKAQIGNASGTTKAHVQQERV
jgi:NAD/NADP transhydrogenase beta subunit